MDGPPTFDLQCHSRHSDGELDPAEVVGLAAVAGVRTLALTDHDTVDGVAEALLAGEAHGVRVVSAVEISAVHSRREDLHVLGYGLDHSDERLAGELAGFREDRVRRAQAMTEALRDAGLTIDDDVLAARRRAGLPVGRPHLAGAVFSHPANAERLASEGLGDFSAVLEAYLLPGRPGYRPRTMPTVVEAIQSIHAAGGIAVWAHPFWDVQDTDEVVELLRRFREWGLDGVEAFYVTHSAAQTRAVCEEAQALGLLRTGSSDFHGPGHRLFSRWRAFELYGCEPALGPIAGP
jgi:predicted metal-dependent phosphoesterase TrpH